MVLFSKKRVFDLLTHSFHEGTDFVAKEAYIFREEWL